MLSYATNSVSQLDTTYQLKLGYALSEPHLFTIQAGKRSSRLDGQLLHRQRLEYSFGWDWQINQYWQNQLHLAHFEQQDRLDEARNRNEIFWKMSWLW